MRHSIYRLQHHRHALGNHEANLGKEDLEKHLRGGALKLPEAVSLALDI